jgi:hypothetical protein
MVLPTYGAARVRLSKWPAILLYFYSPRVP